MRLLEVVGVALRLGHEAVGVALEDFREGVVVAAEAVVVLLAEVVAGENQCAAGVFLFGVAEEVGGVGDLRLDLLLAVAEVGVGDDGDDDPALVAGADLERPAAVVELAVVLPAHTVALLPVGGLVDVREGRAPPWSPWSGGGRG